MTPNSARSPATGVAALVLAALFSSTVWLLVLPFALASSLPMPEAPLGLGWPIFIQTAGLLVSLVLGVAATLTGRGRWWGVAAILLSVLGSAYLTIGLSYLIPEPGKGG
jgi:hypothetical protein